MFGFYGNDGFIAVGTGQNSSGILYCFWCYILSGCCQMKEIGY